MSELKMREARMISAAILAGAIVAAPVTANAAAKISFSGIVEAHAYLKDDASENDQHIEAGDVRLQATIENEVGPYTGYATYRIDADGLSGTELTSDSITAGLRGDFGDIAIGEVTKVASMGELANDMHGFNEDSERHLGYTNSFGPVSLAVTYSPEDSQDQTGLGLQYSAGGLTLGLGYDTGKIGDEFLADEAGVIVGAKYAFGAHSIAVHHGSRDTFEVTAVEGGFGFGDWGLTLTYSTLEDVSDIFRINLSRDLAKAISWGIRYETTSPVDGEDTSFLRTTLALSF